MVCGLIPVIILLKVFWFIFLYLCHTHAHTHARTVSWCVHTSVSQEQANGTQPCVYTVHEQSKECTHAWVNGCVSTRTCTEPLRLQSFLSASTLILQKLWGGKGGIRGTKSGFVQKWRRETGKRAERLENENSIHHLPFSTCAHQAVNDCWSSILALSYHHCFSIISHSCLSIVCLSLSLNP